MEFIHNRLALTAAVGAVGAMLLSGCVDDSYDLADIDSTTRIEVKDLTLPLNLTPVMLDSLVDLSSEESIEKINGEYVLIKSGTFSSKPIMIKAIVATIPDPEPMPAGENLPIYGGEPVPVTPCDYRFNYIYYGVDDYILDLESATVDFDMTVTISVKNSAGNGVSSTFSALSFRVPAGLYGYCVETGQKINGPADTPVITFTDDYVADNGVFTCTYHVERIVKDDAGITIAPDPATGDRTFYYPGTISFLGGKVKANNSGNGETTGHVAINFDLKTLEVFNLTGTIRYDLQDLDAEHVELDNLPEILTQDADITLSNPQIYMSVENPLADYGVRAATKLRITPYRDNVQTDASTIAYMPDSLFVEGTSGTQNFCLTPAPQNVTSFYAPFANPEPKKVLIENLGRILAGNRLPQSVGLEFEGSRMLKKHVRDFAIGTELGSFSGNYTLYAPLQFGNGSTIIYSDTQKGWGLDSDLVISRLAVKARVDSDLPVTVNLTAKAIDENGNEIPGVVVSPVTVEAGQSDIEILMTGDIRHLDGIKYTATILTTDDASVLDDTMSIKLSDIKVVVSGFYESSDDDDDDEYYN